MAWEVLRDFNAILHPEKRMRGEGMQNAELIDFAKFLEESEL